MKFSIKGFFSKCDQIRRKLLHLVTFTEKILNEKLDFLCSARWDKHDCFDIHFHLITPLDRRYSFIQNSNYIYFQNQFSNILFPESIDFSNRYNSQIFHVHLQLVERMINDVNMTSNALE